MRNAITLLAVCSLPATSAFTVVGPLTPPHSTKLMSSSENYLGNLRNGVNNAVTPSTTGTSKDSRKTDSGLEQRLDKLSRMEKLLETKLNDLSRKERNMEERLKSLSQTERTLDQRLSTRRDDRRVSGGSDQRRFDNQRLGVDRYNSYSRDSRSDLKQTSASASSLARSINEIWDTATPTTVQGGSLRTWAFANPAIRRVHVLLKTDGRPLDADVELWNGPDNTPHKMKVYVEDGGLRTFSTFIETPRSPNTVCIKNTGQLEFPLYGVVGVDREAGDSFLQTISRGKGEIVQGGAIRTYAFDPEVDSVAVMIRTDGRPLNARIELLQGPNNNKQVLALYTEDGLDRPFMAVIQTPGSGNVVRVVNTAPVEFPMLATVVEHEVGGFAYSEDPYWNDGIQIGRTW